MESIFNSFLLVAATEMGDKTQLLAFVLATRFRNPAMVLAGIFVATILNHSLAAFVGQWVAQVFTMDQLKWILATSFFAFALWVLKPDQDDDEGVRTSSFGAFLTTLIAFFLAEMGDKTQLSTVVLAAKYQNIFFVTVGTTLGMMFSDGLAVLFGEKLTQKISMLWIRRLCSMLFVLFGVAMIVGF